VAFGSTCRKDCRPDEDKVTGTLIQAGTRKIVIFGKSWDLHVNAVLKTSLEQNLEMVTSTIRYLRDHKREVIFDAEHFFDGYRENPDYARQVVTEAEKAGARNIVLCDTNGGSLPSYIKETVATARQTLHRPLGIHCHNDLGLATANSVSAVEAGATHVQGTINGLGERCGNANLIEIIAALHLKLGVSALRSGLKPEDQLKNLTKISSYVADISNMPPDAYAPIVGANAFAHKGGVHIDAILKHPRAYEHINPEIVGNMRRIGVSELAGKAAVIAEAEKLGIDLRNRKETVENILQMIKVEEAKGQHLEDADGTVHMMILRALGMDSKPFELAQWEASTYNDSSATARLTVMVDREFVNASGTGVGPVHAIDRALRKALVSRFPVLDSTQLVSYKVTVVDTGRGTASLVRVFIEFRDGDRTWTTTSLSENVIEASVRALVEGYTYRLIVNGKAVLSDGAVRPHHRS
jgi:2-isopropylmalate synthase